MSSRVACGACGVSCGDGELCVDGVCAAFCPTGQTLIGSGVCVNLDSDPQNCGGEGVACTTGELCAGGACTVACGVPRAACGRSCADLETDVSHCGACDSPCDVGLACLGGSCVDPCDGLPTADGRPLATLTMLVPRGNAARIRHAYMISEALRELGIVGVVRRVGFSVLLDQFDPATRRTGIEGFDLLFVGFTPVTPRPVNEDLVCGSSGNFMGWCNAAFDDARRVYDSSLNPAMRSDALREMQEIFIDELPMFLLYFSSSVWGVPTDLSRFDGQFGVFAPHDWSGPSELSIALPVPPDSMNPIFRDSIYEVYPTALLFERLFMLDADRASSTYGRPIPLLATDVPTIVATGVGTEHSVTIDLRPSRFSDGHPVDAYDVAFSYQLLLRSEADVPSADDLRALGLTSQSIDVVDADTIRFRFPNATPDFAYLMDVHVLPLHYWLPHATAAEADVAYRTLLDAGGSYVGPVPLEGDAFDDGSETFGSGPFAFAPGGAWDPVAGVMQLTRNPMSGTVSADIADVTIRHRTREEVLTELATGAALFLDSNYAFTPDDLSEFPAIRVPVNTSLGYQQMGPNLATPFLSAVEVRRAIDLVIPRQRIVDETLGGLGEIGHGYLSPSSPFHDPDFGEGGPFGPVFDSSAARATLRAAGHMSLDADAPTLRTFQAQVCNYEEAVSEWVDAGRLDRASADQILADLARSRFAR